jgi:hypothetical protein
VTLTDVHNDPRLLADFLRVPFEPREVSERSPYGYRTVTRTAPPEGAVRDAWGEYRAALDRDWLARHRGQTRGQFVAECLSEGLGIKNKGKLADRIDYAIRSRPDLYSRLDPADGT